MVAAARKAGVNLAAIRRARDYCSKELTSKFPFAEYRFKTDGKELWLDLVDIDGRTGTGKLVSTSQHGQLGWSEIIGRLREFDYDRNFGLATRWHVAGRGAQIIIDPRISFGAPSVQGIPTQLLKMRWEAGEPAESLAEDYGVPETHILSALKFEGIEQAAGAWRKN